MVKIRRNGQVTDIIVNRDLALERERATILNLIMKKEFIDYYKEYLKHCAKKKLNDGIPDQDTEYRARIQ